MCCVVSVWCIGLIVVLISVCGMLTLGAVELVISVSAFVFSLLEVLVACWVVSTCVSIV